MKRFRTFLQKALLQQTKICRVQMNKKPTFNALFKPSSICGLRLKNRIVMAPMTTGLASMDGYVTDKLKNYYEKRAAGGVGLIIVEATCVDSTEGKSLAPQLFIDNDRFIPGLCDLVDRIHKHDVKAILQLDHRGRETSHGNSGLQGVAPSANSIPSSGIVGRLTIAEIGELVERFGEAAGRAKKAGFDGVELCGCHDSLISKFLSGYTNKRSDGYGGGLENRCRFFLEILKRVKQAAGKDYPVFCRINAIEYGADGGFGIKEAKQLSRMLEELGADIIDVSIYGYGSYSMLYVPYFNGFLLPVASVIKEALRIPVIGVGNITPEMGNRALIGEMVDFIAIGRGLIADPDWANRVNEGKVETIRPCISCLRCLSSIFYSGTHVECSVNPEVGVENEWQSNIAQKPRKVLVIGGGPAGMEAARVSALRGHQVILFEKKQKLGGQLHLAAKPPYKHIITALLTYLKSQIEELDVRLELGKEATASVAESIKPDVIIVATGAATVVPNIPGIKSNNVVAAEDVLNDQAKVGDQVVVMGSETVACETAELLLDLGKKVTIAGNDAEIATRAIPLKRNQLLQRLREKGVKMLTGVHYNAVTEKGLVITSAAGEEQLLKADTIVLAVSVRANDGLVAQLTGKFSEVYVIGDSLRPRGIREALEEGFIAGNKI